MCLGDDQKISYFIGLGPQNSFLYCGQFSSTIIVLLTLQTDTEPSAMVQTGR